MLKDKEINYEALKNFAKNCKMERAKLDLTLKDLSLLSKVSITTISFIESRRTTNVRYNTLYKISKALRKNLKEMLEE